MSQRLAVSLVLGAAAGVFDYRYTLLGNRRGRWDLIVDLNRGFVQLPAVGAYGQPTFVEIDHVADVTIDPLALAANEHDCVYQVQVHCCEEKRQAGEYEPLTLPASQKLRVAISCDRVYLEALAELIRDALALHRHPAKQSG